ncbi:hypothetical protein DFP73DRAFT_343398 [Morchella snyderi]|nr:hypothetical protein DFP73DRAFT_343398 [Morchella snyderi]
MPTYSEDGDGIMGESTYEILTDSTLLTDDEDDASSVASLDENSEEEDSASAEDAESLAEFPVETQHNDPHPGIPAFGGLDEQPLECSGMTMKSDGSISEQITFEEPEEFAGEQISVSHSICNFNEAETSEINTHIRIEEPPPTKLFATVRQTMSKSQLVMNEPFRVLYIGSTVAKDDIITKLGGALAVPITESTSSLSSWESGSKGSRFNVIPVSSFGTRSCSPEVELVESFGVEMAVDVCTTAKSSKRENRPDTICLWLNGNQSVQSTYGEDGPEITTPGWKLPHLAVVFSSDDDNTQKRMTRVYARSFMARHSVPTLVISQNTLYHKPTENFALDTRSVHMCLESQSESKYGNLVHKRLPVDLSTFLNLDVRQLNRNLACITGISSSQEISPAPVGRTRTSSSALFNPLMRDVEKTPHRQDGNATGSLYWIREQKRDDLWKLFLVGWVLVCGLAGATFAIAYMKFSKSSIEVEDITETVIKAVTAITASSTTVLAVPTSISAFTSIYTAMQSTPSISTACGPKMDISSLIYDSSLLSLNESDQFSIHVIGDNHILVRPPQKYLLLKKPPALFVEVTRGGAKIEAELSKPFDGVYTLKLDAEEAWGLMNVSLWTKQKPVMKETLEVDFGSPWLKLSGWKKVAGQKKTELQTLIEQAKTDANRIASDFSQIAGQQALEVKGLVVAKAREFTKGVSKIYRGTREINVKRLFNSAPPSVYVQTAQRQAKNVWEKKVADMAETTAEAKKRGWLRR